MYKVRPKAENKLSVKYNSVPLTTSAFFFPFSLFLLLFFSLLCCYCFCFATVVVGIDVVTAVVAWSSCSSLKIRSFLEVGMPEMSDVFTLYGISGLSELSLHRFSFLSPL